MRREGGGEEGKKGLEDEISKEGSEKRPNMRRLSKREFGDCTSRFFTNIKGKLTNFMLGNHVFQQQRASKTLKFSACGGLIKVK